MTSLKTSPYIFNGKLGGGYRLFWSNENLLGLLCYDALLIFDADALLTSTLKTSRFISPTGQPFKLVSPSPCILRHPIDTSSQPVLSPSCLPYILCSRCLIIKEKNEQFSTAVCFSALHLNSSSKTRGDDGSVTMGYLKRRKTKRNKEEGCRKIVNKKVLGSACQEHCKEEPLQHFLRLEKRFSTFCWVPSYYVESTTLSFSAFFLGTSDGSIFELRYIKRGEAVLIIDIREYMGKLYDTWISQKNSQIFHNVVYNVCQMGPLESSIEVDFNLPLTEWTPQGMYQTSFFQWIQDHVRDIKNLLPARAIVVSDKIDGGYLCAMAFYTLVVFFWLEDASAEAGVMGFGCIGAFLLPGMSLEDSITACCFTPFTSSIEQFHFLVLYVGTAHGTFVAIPLRFDLSSRTKPVLDMSFYSVSIIQRYFAPITSISVKSTPINTEGARHWFLLVAVGSEIHGFVASSFVDRFVITHTQAEEDTHRHQSNIVGLCFMQAVDVSHHVATYVETVEADGTYCLFRFIMELKSTPPKGTLKKMDVSVWNPNPSVHIYNTRGSQNLVEKYLHASSSACNPQSTNIFGKSATISLYGKWESVTLTLSVVNECVGLGISPSSNAHCAVYACSDASHHAASGTFLGLSVESCGIQDVLSTVLNDLLAGFFQPLMETVQNMLKDTTFSLNGEVHMMRWIKRSVARRPLHWMFLKLQVKQLLFGEALEGHSHAVEEKPLTYSEIGNYIQGIGDSEGMTPPAVSWFFGRIIKMLGHLPWSMTESRSSQETETFGHMLCFLLHHLNEIVLLNDQTLRHELNPLVSSLLEFLCTQLSKLVCATSSMNSNAAEQRSPYTSVDNTDSQSNDSKMWVSGYIHLLLCRCLFSLWSLVEPAFWKSSQLHSDISSRLKHYYIVGCSRALRSGFVQSNFYSKTSLAVCQSLLTTASLCMETKTPLCGICPYCNNTTQCPPPYIEFHCSSTTEKYHTVPISFLTLLPCRGELNASWACTLCTHVFQWPLSSSITPTLTPFTDDIPSSCPLCLGNTRELTLPAL